MCDDVLSGACAVWSSRSDQRLQRQHHHRHECLSEAADHAAEAEIRDERLALQRGARDRRGVLGAQPLCDGRALVGEAIQRADWVGHDLGGDRANVVVRHLHCLARFRRAGRPAVAAPAAVSHRSLQRPPHAPWTPPQHAPQPARPPLPPPASSPLLPPPASPRARPPAASPEVCRTWLAPPCPRCPPAPRVAPLRAPPRAQTARRLRWLPAAPPPPVLEPTRLAWAQRRAAGRARLQAAPCSTRRLRRRRGLPCSSSWTSSSGPAPWPAPLPPRPAALPSPYPPAPPGPHVSCAVPPRRLGATARRAAGWAPRCSFGLGLWRAAQCGAAVAVEQLGVGLAWP
eukprot:scaffold44064_cov70-Phaeocystis_antarctica.AAC.6